MNKFMNCLVGRDRDDDAALAGFIMGIVIVICIVAVVLTLIFYAGAIIGGFHSLKNYFLSFKNNVVDSNRVPVPAA